MPLAIDSTGYGYGSTGTFSYSHTCSGSDRVLVVGISDRNGNANGDVVTGVTYNGVAMTRVEYYTAGSLQCAAWLYVLINPATGTHNVTVSNSNSAIALSSTSASYTGCDQTTQPSSHNQGAATTQNYGLAVTSPTNGWVVSFISSYYTAITSITNGTDRTGASYAYAKLADSNSAVSGSYTITFNSSNSSPYSYTIVQLTLNPLATVNTASFFALF